MALLLACGSASGYAAGLTVALTNDDGWDSPGIQAVQQVLQQQGHTVLMAAPGTNQSGSSAAMSVGALQIRREADRQFSIWTCRDKECATRTSASPATSALAAIDLVRQINQGRVPDLLVSGINAGANLGASTLISGTVGAAMVAAARPFGGGVPAIAISTDVPAACDRNAACEKAHYQSVAGVLAKLLAALQDRQQRSRQNRLLPFDMVMNINVPPTPLRAVRVNVTS